VLNRRSLVGLGIAALATTARAQAGDPAVATVQGLYDAYDAALKGGGDVRARFEAIKGPMAKAFDFPAMLRTAAGPRFRDIPEARQPALADAFARMVTATYATRMSSAKGGKFTVQSPSEARAGGTKLVRTKVTDASGDDSPVDFILSAGDRITDVLLQGTVSEVATFRSNFAEPLKSGADGLLAYMQKQADGMLAAK
jgi:phospholipid transport system substrate-binding protein